MPQVKISLLPGEYGSVWKLIGDYGDATGHKMDVTEFIRRAINVYGTAMASEIERIIQMKEVASAQATEVEVEGTNNESGEEPGSPTGGAGSVEGEGTTDAEDSGQGEGQVLEGVGE